MKTLYPAEIDRPMQSGADQTVIDGHWQEPSVGIVQHD